MTNFWKDRNVFVTGIGGFLGSWLAEALVKNGANVTGLLRDFVPSSNFLDLGMDKKVSVARGSITDYDLIERVIKEYEIKTCFHLAAVSTVPVANSAPKLTFETNVAGTWNVLEACRNSGVEEVLIASSDKAYGIKENLPYSEEDPLTGRYTYDASKSCADLIAQSYFYTYGLNAGITRCGNFFGGGDLNFNRIVPGTIKSLIFGERPIIRSDGSFKRDYVYVKDVVSGYLRFAELLRAKSLGGNAFNLSMNKPVSVIDLVNAIIQAFGSDLKPDILNITKGEIKDQYLTSKKANEVLGWTPKYTFEQALQETAEWYKKYFQSQ